MTATRSSERRNTTTTAEGRYRREVILRVSGRLFAREGLERTSMRDIAEASGILAGSIYHHFASKDEIILGILETSANDLSARYQQVRDSDLGAAEKLEAIIRATFEHFRKCPDAAEIYGSNERYIRSTDAFRPVQRAIQGHISAWNRVITDVADAGLFREELPISTLSTLLRQMTWSTRRYRRPPGPEVTEAFIAVSLGGCLGRNR